MEKKNLCLRIPRNIIDVIDARKEHLSRNTAIIYILESWVENENSIPVFSSKSKEDNHES